MVLGNGKSKRWIHSPDTLLNGRATYTVKFLGKAEVPEPRGMAMVKMALQKLSFSRQLKRTEGTKPPKVELGINVNSVTISDLKTKETLHNIALHRVSFCADDKGDKRLFAFIAKLDDDKHYCYGLDSLHQANDITLTIGQAFEIAYEKFVQDTPSQGGKKVLEMSKRIKELESENTKLRQRIAELEAVNRASERGGAGASVSTTGQVPIESNPLDQPVYFPTHNITRRRTSSPLLTGGTRPEVIVDPISTFSFSSALPSICQPQLSFTGHIQPPRSSLLEDDDIYGTIERGINGLSMGYDADKDPKTLAFDSVVKEKSAKRYRKTRSRKKKEKSPPEKDDKNVFANLMPTSLLPKNSKRTQNHSEKESRVSEEFSSPASSQSSGTYASVDDVIATLRKMMNRDGDASDPNHRALNDFLHENVVRDEAPKPSKDAKVSSKLFSQALENRLKTSYLDPESSNSHDDLTSVSSSTTDSSSQEYSYVLQPNLMKKRSRFKAAPVSDSKMATNIDAMLHRLSGENGYMVLAGRNCVQGSLDKQQSSTSINQYTVDTTYDNVNKLMEAYRKAAAKDASLTLCEPKPLKDSIKSTMGAKSLSKPKAGHVKQRCAVASSSSAETTPFYAQSSMKSFKLPGDAIAAADSSSFSLRSFRGIASNIGKAPPPNYKTNDDRMASLKTDLLNRNDWLSCRETDIVDREERCHGTTDQHGFDLRRTSQDVFNMQPFVPKLPLPPERSPRRNRAESSGIDPFSAMNFAGVSTNDEMDMRKFNNTHAVLTPSGSKKSDYHILSHPLLRKKRKHDLKPLKWSKKHFSVGMKKRAGSSKTSARIPPARNSSFNLDNAFSQGLAVSEGNLTLDAFDPLKS